MAPRKSKPKTRPTAKRRSRVAEEKKLPVLTRRTFVLGAAGITISSILLARLYHLQFLQGDRYRTMADGNRIKLHLTPPMRGTITDRQGIPLATNEQNYRMLLRTEQNMDLAKTLADIHALVPIAESRMKEILEKRRPGKYAPPLLLKEYLTWDEVARIEFHSASIPGLLIEVGQVRYYPFNETFAHVIGYVGRVTEKYLNKHPEDMDLLKLPDFKVGIDGVEQKLEIDLRGKPGVKEVEVNVHGQAVRELNTTLSIPGKEIHLTLNQELQSYAYDLLKNESAAGVVIDLERGDILMLLSDPAFDPNQFSKGITSKYYKELRENKKVPLMNKALYGQYPPGSTFKMLVGLAALEANVMGPNDSVYCPGHFFLGNHRFNCWKPGGHGTVNLSTALAHSCDTYFYTAAQRTGIDRISKICYEFGLGRTYDLPVGVQSDGIVPSPEWKKRKKYGPWQTGDTVNVGIGQGYVLTTPLQLAVMAARIASGNNIMPRLVIPSDEDPDAPLPVWDKLPMADKNMDIIRNAMSMVTNTPGGTAYGKRITDPQYAMAGKTGTAQVRKITVRGQDQNTIPWEYRHHGLFVAHAPVDNPKYAAALVVEHGGAGGVAAAYVRDILHHAQKTDARARSDFKSIFSANAASVILPGEQIGPMPNPAILPFIPEPDMLTDGLDSTRAAENPSMQADPTELEE